MKESVKHKLLRQYPTCDDSSSVPSSSDEDEDAKEDLTHNYDNDISSSEDDKRQTDMQSSNEVLELSITSNRRESSSNFGVTSISSTGFFVFEYWWS